MGGVVDVYAAQTKQAADLAFYVRRRRALGQPRRVLKSDPVGRRHRRQEENGGEEASYQTRHQQSETCLFL